MSVRIAPKMILMLLAASAGLAVAGPASADPIGDLKGVVGEAGSLGERAKELDKEIEGLGAAEKAKLVAKRDRLKIAHQGIELFAKALEHGRPLPFYVEKPNAKVINCGDAVWFSASANDKALQSEHGQEGPGGALYKRANVGLNGKDHTQGSPNITIECKTKKKGEVLEYGDEFAMNMRPGAKDLDDGRTYLFPCDSQCGSDPLLRTEPRATITGRNGYWSLRLAKGPVQPGIPAELVASNREDKGNVGGFCGVGPGGLYPTVRFNFHNHCNLVHLAAAVAAEGYGKPPAWTKKLLDEVKALYSELKEDVKKAKAKK